MGKKIKIIDGGNNSEPVEIPVRKINIEPDLKNTPAYKGLVLAMVVSLIFLFGGIIHEANAKASGVIGCINGVNFETSEPDAKNGCTLGGNYPRNWRAITLKEGHIEVYKELGATYTEALDLAMIKSLECGNVKGNCDNGNDIGPFQINRAMHPLEANHSIGLLRAKKWDELFKYQAKWTLGDMRSKNRLCGDYYTRQKSKCRAMVHNGNVAYFYPTGYNPWAKYSNGTHKCEKLLYSRDKDKACLEHRMYYSILGWEERKFIKQYFKDNLSKYEDS